MLWDSMLYRVSAAGAFVATILVFATLLKLGVKRPLVRAFTAALYFVLGVAVLVLRMPAARWSTATPAAWGVNHGALAAWVTLGIVGVLLGLMRWWSMRR